MFFDRLKGLLTKKDDPTETNWNEKRVHARYEVAGTCAIALSAPFGDNFVNDISYGGLSIVKRAPFSSVPESLSGNLEILGKRHPCQLRKIRMSPIDESAVFAAFQFQHDVPDLLLALREVIEPMRRGASIREIDKDIVKESYRSEDWSFFRGEGPCDLAIRRLNQGPVSEALITVPDGEHYLEVSFTDGKLLTTRSQGLSSAPGVPGDVMKVTADDKEAKRIVLALLLGLPKKLRNDLLPVLIALMNDLGIRHLASA